MAKRKKKRLCRNPACFDFTTRGRARVSRNGKKFCSRSCYGAFLRGRDVNRKNYVRIRINGKRVYLHRWKMEQILGRELLATEIVHHIDYDPFNNDESNLQLFASNAEHLAFHAKNPFPPGKEKELIQSAEADYDFWMSAGRKSPANLILI